MASLAIFKWRLCTLEQYHRQLEYGYRLLHWRLGTLASFISFIEIDDVGSAHRCRVYFHTACLPSRLSNSS
jgi:hypothetical protein